MMIKSPIDRIDRTREAWSSELEVCRNDILDTVRLQHAVSRLVVEFDYLLVEAKLALERMNDSDEALNKHLDWLDECDKARAKAAENEKRGQHKCRWVLGDIGTNYHVRVGYVCESPSCGEFLTVIQVGVRLNEWEILKAELAEVGGEIERLRSRFKLIQETVNTPDGKMSVLELFTQLDRACNDTLFPDILEGKC